MNGIQISIAVGVAILVVAGAVAALMIRGKKAEVRKSRVTRMLKKHAMLRGWKVLSNVTLNTGKETVKVDNILVGYFGLLFISVQAEDLDYYGGERDETWSMVKESKSLKYRFPNPLASNLKAMDALRKVFAKNEVYNVQMEQLVVFCSKFRKNSLNIKETLPIVNVRRLRALLGKSRFEKDCGLDLERVAALITQAQES